MSTPKGLSPRVRGNRAGGLRCAGLPGSIPACAGEPNSGVAFSLCGGVYPRVCGGTVIMDTPHWMGWGLSPRVRGNPTPPDAATPPARSIPACAGEPYEFIALIPGKEVYPRVCGGTSWTTALRPTTRGLSPRVRGNHRAGLQAKAQVRSIPACAGEPSNPSTSRQQAEVYPRVCGGTQPTCSNCIRRSGLSPRVRGNRRWPDAVSRFGRSIPACAGEPRSGWARTRRKRVYPRVCGGTLAKASGSGLCPGLSPRVRGNRPTARLAGQHLGSIPACAGEPVFSAMMPELPPVYPRVCGGTVKAVTGGASVTGLSPRVRGNRWAAEEGRLYMGSIPACAGEPDAEHLRRIRQRVYPRVCGGTGHSIPRRNQGTGLSPRVRGNLAGRGGDAGCGRSIPACAGEPARGRVFNRQPGVYPRVCGGTCWGYRLTCSRGGLSPRVRGNPVKSMSI